MRHAFATLVAIGLLAALSTSAIADPPVVFTDHSLFSAFVNQQGKLMKSIENFEESGPRRGARTRSRTRCSTVCRDRHF